MDDIYTPEAWERRPDETSKAYEAFCVYRDMGTSRSIAKVGAALGKNRVTLEQWSSKYSWVKRAAAWDSEKDRIARELQIQEIAETRKRQRDNARKMQEKGMEFLDAVVAGEPQLRDIVQLMKLGMEQERICMGDVGEVIEERDGGHATEAVTFYMPDNGRDKREGTE